MAQHVDPAATLTVQPPAPPAASATRIGPASVAPPSAIRVEIADADRFSALAEAWTDLTARTAEPNPFLDPAFTAGAATTAAARGTAVLLAWGGERLVGAWAFARTRPRAGLPLTVLTAPIHPILALGAPVLDRGHAEPALAAMLDALAATRDLPKILLVNYLDEDRPAARALAHALAARRAPSAVLWRSARPMLPAGGAAADYFAAVLSGSRRRKLGQLRRKLAMRGRLELKIHREAAAVAQALPRFLALEAAGWKGSLGHSMAHMEGKGAMVRALLPSMAARGAVEIWELALDDAAVSMAIILRQVTSAGATLFDWKIAYDERHADCSPGVLLAMDYTGAFLDDPSVIGADSCASDDSGLLGALWTGRQPLVTLALDVRPDGSLAFRAWIAAEHAYRAARRAAKAPYHAAHARLRKLLRRGGADKS
ncbi:MAG: GNAT family N-acetyltransferase [Variibacter sp.]|nr:GNAT family N-acetyltransferase [Variibacter sp.]